MILRLGLCFFIIAFVLFWKEMACWEVVAFGLLVGWALLHEIFSYRSASKYALHDGLFHEHSLLKHWLSGKTVLTVKSLIFAFILTLIILLHVSFLDNLGVLTLLVGILTFLAIKKIALPLFARELRYGENTAKVWLFWLNALVMSVFHTLLLFWWHTPFIPAASLRHVLVQANYNPVVQCALLEDIHALAYYLHLIKTWALGTLLHGDAFWTGLAFLSLSTFGYMVFFFALSHLYSWVFSPPSSPLPKALKPGYFILTLLLLAYLTGAFYAAGMFANHPATAPLFKTISQDLSQETTRRVAAPTRVVRLYLGEKEMFIPLEDLPKIREEIARYKHTLLTQTHDVLSVHTQEAFAASQEAIVTAFANWYYSALTDYALLLAWASTGSVDVAIERKFEEIFATHFPKDFHEKTQAMFHAMETQFQQHLTTTLASYQLTTTAPVLVSPLATDDFYDAFAKLHARSLERVSLSAGFSALSLTALGTLAGKTAIKTAGKTLTKSATSVGAVLFGAGTGLSCGPFAVVCSPVFALSAWIATDYGFAKVDEALHRDALEEDIQNALTQTRDALALRLQDQATQSLDALESLLY